MKDEKHNYIIKCPTLFHNAYSQLLRSKLVDCKALDEVNVVQKANLNRLV
jgi:hypothetical protein